MPRLAPTHLHDRARHGPSTEAPARPSTADRSTDAVPRTRLHVLLPLDGSALGHRAFPHVAKLLDPERHHLRLLRVGDGREAAPGVPPPRSMVLTGWPGAMTTEAELDLMQHPIYDSQLWEAFRNELSDDMSDEVAALRDAGFDVTLEVRTGDPVDEILATAGENDSDLIVMTTHGRSGLSKALMGSVTEGVLRRADVPVLILRPRAD